MSWVKVDDKAWAHPKLASLSAAAVRLWLFTLCWCNQQETDGQVPRRILSVLGGSKKAAAELVASGLWERTDNGWLVHDFLKYQPSRAQRDSQREALRERVSRHRKREGNGVTSPLLTDRKRESNTAPVPSRPDPEERSPLPPANDPPPRDPMAYLDGPARERPDVLRVVERWKRIFGFSGFKFIRGNDLEAQIVADAIDAHGEETCLLVLEYAPNDEWVSGRADDNNGKHESLAYIFGKAHVFARIHRAAEEGERRKSDSKPSSIIERAKARKVEGAA